MITSWLRESPLSAQPALMRLDDTTWMVHQ
jgi:hypothetical protein